MGDLEGAEKLNSIDAAIAVCDKSVRRHSLATIQELVVTVVLVGALVAVVFRIASLQGMVGDFKIRELQVASSQASARVQRAYEAVQEARSGVFVNAEAQEAKLKEVKAEWTQALEAEDVAQKAFASYRSPVALSDSLLYGTGALTVILVAIFAGLYRLRMREVIKNEQFKFGLLRIRIAGANADAKGFDGEVRTALTKGAFDAPAEESSGFGRRGKIESPLPGHPTSDLSTAVLNRLLEQVDVVFQPKGKTTSKGLSSSG